MGLGFSAGAARGATFLGFMEESGAPGFMPEFVYSPTEGLRAGTGAEDNNGMTTAPGLTFVTGLLPPFILSDNTLSLGDTGFMPSAPAVFNPVLNVIEQGLTGGSFTLKTSDGTVLLTGVADDALISRTTSNSASILSGQATYNGGTLLPLMISAGLGTHGTFSFDLSALTGTTSIGSDGYLTAFSADASGGFAAVPTPAAAFGGATLLGTLAVGRLRKRRGERA